MPVPADALYGAQTARARENFPISGLRFPRPFLRALGMIKQRAAQVNLELGLLHRERAMAIMEAAEEVITGELDGHFVLDIFQTELNVMMPLMTHNLLQSIELLSRASRQFQAKCVKDLQADRKRCESLVEQSLAMVTSLAPVIGYDRAAALAKQAWESGRTVREVALAERLLSEEELTRILDPRPMTEPGIAGRS
ncbi:MAG: lyase family protein [Trichloromonas sp.]|jgi:fumarate hydratase class II|nr:lyase family protein [Trichloromonas sp.]